ncbi:MAG: hypothetical protein LUD81_10740 [Clostridiales bacterium]|nr:hypothetical protein [Clostridiales bacterium]
MTIKKSKRLLSLLLALAMVFSLMNVNIYADGTDTNSTEVVTEETSSGSAVSTDDDSEETTDEASEEITEADSDETDSTSSDSSSGGSSGSGSNSLTSSNDGISAVSEDGEEDDSGSTTAAASVTTGSGDEAETKNYDTLEAAFDAAGDGSTVTLQSAITMSELIEWTTGSVTLDLNGHDITNTISANNVINISGGSLTITGSGTIKNASENTDKPVIRIEGSNDEDAEIEVNIGKNVTLEGDGYGLMVVPYLNGGTSGTNACGVKVNIEGTVTGSSEAGFYVNGQAVNTTIYPEITVASTAKISGGACGIYLAGYAEVTVEDGAAVTGETGIEIRAGILNVNGGTIKGTATTGSSTANGSGVTTTGAGIAIVQHSTGLPISVTISGGTISGYYGVYENNTQGTSSYDSVSVSITGGTITTTDTSGSAVAATVGTTTITGGTYNTDVSDYTDYVVTTDDDGNYTVTTEKYVAQIGDKKYTSLGAAIADVPVGTSASNLGAETTITILCDIDDAEGVSIPSYVDLIIDFNNTTYTLTGPGAGSTNTQTNGFQLLKDSDIVMKNGTIQIAEDATRIYRIIQSYANVTFVDMTFYTRNQLGGEDYALSFNYGTITFSGNTNIYSSNSSVIAFDVYYWAGAYENGTTVIFDDTYTGTIDGVILYDTTDEDKATLEINGNGTFGGISLSTDAANLDSVDITITGGTFATDVTDYLDESLTQDESGTVVSATAVAKIGSTEYYSLASAVSAAKDGDTIYLLSDISLSSQLSVAKKVTIDLSGYTLTRTTSNTDTYLIQVTTDGDLTVTDSSTGETGAVKAGIYTSDGSNYYYGYGILVYGDLTVSGTTVSGGYYSICTFDTSATLTVTDSTISGVARAVHLGYCGEAQFKDSTISAGTYGIIAFNGSLATIEDCTISGSTAGVYATGDDTSVIINGENTNINANDGTENGTYGIMIWYEASVTINEGTISGGYAGIAMWGDGTDSTNLIVNGGSIYGETIGISSNGSSGNGNVVIVINDGSVDGGGLGMYLPAVDSTTTINGGTITGLASGIEIRAGELIVNGGIITSTAEYLEVNYNGNGTTVYGAGIAVSQHSTNDDLSVTITGGEIEGYYGIYEVNTYYNKNSSAVSIAIEEAEGSTITITANGGEAVYSESMDSSSEYAYSGTSVEISSGTFSTAPDLDYCVEGYAPVVNEDGTYTVSTAVAAVYDTEESYVSAYSTLTEAFAAALEGYTVALIGDVTEAAEFSSSSSVTLDLNGYTLTSASAYTLTVTGSGTLTITDSSDEADGAVTNTKSGGNAVYVNSQTATVNVESGTIKAVGVAINVNEGNVNLSGGTFEGGAALGEAEASETIVCLKAATSNCTVTVTGGFYNGYAFAKPSDAETSPISVSGGYYTVNNWSVNNHLASGCSISEDNTYDGYGYTITAMAIIVGTYDSDDNFTAIKGYGSAYMYNALSQASTLELESGQTAGIVLNGDYTEKTVTIPADATIILDLNGYTVGDSTAVRSAIAVNAGATLTIIDSSGGSGTVTSANTAGGTIRNYGGTLIINEGTYVNTDQTQKYSPVIYSAVQSGYSSEGVSASTTINGGTFSSYGRAAHLNIGELTVNGGVFTAKAIHYAATGTTVNDYTSIKVATQTVEDDTGERTLYTYVVNRVASVTSGETTTYYETLAEAVEAASSGAEIDILTDVYEDVVIPASADVTIDLNGCMIQNVSSHTITNYGTLTVIDSVGGGKVDNVTHAKAAIVNYGTAYLYGGTFDRSGEVGTSSSDNGGNSYYTVKNYNVMVIGNGTDTVNVNNNGSYSSCIANGYQNSSDKSNAQSVTGDVTPTLTINADAYISGGLNTVKNDDCASLVITGGTLTNSNQDVIQNHSTAEISGGTFTATGDADVIYNCGCDEDLDKGVLTITGGTFTASENYPYVIIDVSTADGSSVTIEDGTFTGTIWTSDSSAAEWAVSGGSFSEVVEPEYCADGYTPVTTKDETTGMYTVKKFNLGISSDDTTEVPATIYVDEDDGVMYVKVSGENIAKYYSNSVYPTTSETFGDDSKGYVFAGWYSETSDGNELSGVPTSEDAYAKFVDADLLNVQCYVTDDGGTYFWRFITSLDNLNYEDGGFIAYCDDSADTASLVDIGFYTNSCTIKNTTTKVEASSDGSTSATSNLTNPKILKSEFHSDAACLVSACYKDTSNSVSKITVTPYWITADGTTVYGTTYTFVYEYPTA